MKHVTKSLTFIFILSILLLPLSANAQENPNVKAVLFYSPTCGHCHIVLTETLPHLWQSYGGTIEIYRSPYPEEGQQDQPPFVAFLGDQLSVLHVDIATPEGNQLFTAALEAFDLPATEGVVPTLFVGDIRLVGSGDIPAIFPTIITSGLKEGGIDWPAIPGVEDIISGLILESIEELPTPAPVETETPDDPVPVNPGTKPGVWELFKQDLLGNSLSVAVLIGMLVSLGFVFSSLRNPRNPSKPLPIHWVILPILVLGFVVAGYLSYVETSGTDAVCGPVGDCNTVQNSSYAMLLGMIHVGTLGIIGYVAIAIAWVISLISSRRFADYALMAIFAMAIFGTLFSIYLTFLEPFVIGATCAWCLTSAVLMTAILLLSMKPATYAYARLRKSTRKRR